MTKQAVVYSRFSPRPDAKECDSNVSQNRRCTAFASARHYEIVSYHDDKNVSGATASRPGLNGALAALKPGMVLIVDRNDRLARDMLVALTIHNEVERRGCTIEFADGSPLRATPEGKLFQNILAAFANFEREKFAERTKAGMARKKASGVWCGRPPIGWSKLPGTDKLVRNENEQDAIWSAVILHNKGLSSKEIARRLNEIYGPCRGRPWSARTVRRILARGPDRTCSIRQS